MDREEMIDYLKSHYRYHTLNSWNNSSSYAHDVKIHRLGLPPGLKDKAYEAIEAEDYQQDVRHLVGEFDAYHGYEYQAGFNGRSGGYLVLYQGGRRADGSIFCWPGRSLDQGEDFSDWDDFDLLKRVQIVESFDKLRDDLLAALIYYCLALIPQKVKQLQLKGVTP